MAKKEESRLPMARSWQLLLLGVAFGLALALGGPGTVSAQEGEIVADCEGASVAIDSACEFGDGQEFTVAIQITSVPPGGFFGFQVKMRWDADVLDYRPTDDPNSEAVWAACDVPVRALEPQPETSILFGCVPLAVQATGFVGPVLLFTFVCTGQGTGSLTLAPLADGEQEGSFFLDPNIQPVGPSVESASVTCGGPAVDRPAPEIQPRQEGAFTPGPGQTIAPPDEATPDGPTATPGRAVATVGDVKFVTPEATGDPAAIRIGEDDGGGGLPVWAWTLIGLAIAAGVGGGGFVAWRRMQARGEGAEPDEPQARGEDTEPDDPQARGEGAEPDEPQARGEDTEPDKPS